MSPWPYRRDCCGRVASLSVVWRPRRGVPSATSSKAWWKTSTTALCSAWTVRRITQRRTQYSVRLHPLGCDFKESDYNTHLCDAFPVFSHQDSVLGYRDRQKPRGLQQQRVPIQARSPLLRGFDDHHPLPTPFVSTVKFYCADDDSCLWSNNVDVAWICL